MKNIDKRAKSPLLQNQERFIESIINLSPDIIYIYDLIEQKNVYINDGIRTVLGYSAMEIKEMGNHVVSTLMHPEDFKTYLEVTYPKYSEVKDNEHVIHDYRMKHKNGKWYWLNCSETIYFRDSDGKPKQIFGVIHDITERKHKEDLLKESSENWRATFDGINDSIFLLDPNGVILQANKVSENLFGNKGNIIGRHCYEVVHKMDCRLDGCPFVRMKQSNKRETIVLSFKNKWFEVVVDPILDKNNDIKAAVHVITDITDRKKAELIIQQQNKQLQELNATKDKFFSIIAHDLKSPFLGFLGLTQEIINSAGKISVKELIQLGSAMNQSADNLFKLLQNLLEWAQLQSGLTSLIQEDISLSELINKNVETTKSTSELKGISLNNMVTDQIHAYADEKMISSVLLNLLSNALKFTPRNGTITVSAKEKEDKMIEVSVKDTGVGMPKSMLGNLFEVGEKTGRKGTAGELSTGLGLLLCKEFVEKNGGDIRVESEEGNGSTFYFTLPLCKNII